ncbi:hypothetical protein BTO06_01405 [Tenacibaculum sp. SZ-18]|nr:hypothetical protein BTO06_01405 [Tenacibaculum sp. SZ-18]
MALAYKVKCDGFWFTEFVGVNLLKFPFTKWCFMETILARYGVVTLLHVSKKPIHFMNRFFYSF